MKISSSFSNTNNKQNSFNAIPNNSIFLPNVVGTMGKIANEYIGLPEQKLCQNTLALLIQPKMDLEYAEEDNKVNAAIRTASKAIAGGTTGVIIRKIAISLVRRNLDFNKTNKFSINWLPKKLAELYKTSQADGERMLKEYTNTLGTIAALGVMAVYTNRALDVPFTNDIQDFITGIVKENKTAIKSLCDVTGNRKEKIEKWYTKKKNSIIKIKNSVIKKANSIKKDLAANTSKTEESK